MGCKKILSTFMAVTIIISGLSGVVRASDTGGYPWADARIIKQSTFDWGYTKCLPEIRVAKMCTGHTSMKMGVKYYQSDPWHYDFRNCTSYVAWRVNQDLGVPLYHFGNASNWDEVARSKKYNVDNIPAIGSIAHWNGKLGHVAYVTEVNGDGSVNVDQYNKKGTGEFSSQKNIRAQNYIHIKDISRSAPSAPASLPPVNTPEVQPVQSTDKPSQSTGVKTITEPLVPPVVSLLPLEPANIGQDPLPKQPGFDYSIAVDAHTGQAKVYVVQYSNTKSRKIEVSESNYSDGNSTWAKTTITDIDQIKDGMIKSVMSDSDSDKELDLYLIFPPTVNEPSKGITLSGKSKFKNSIDQWSIPQSIQNSDQVEYSVADLNGDKKMDLYIAGKESNGYEVNVLDGAKGMSEVLSNIHQQVDFQSQNKLLVGDYNRDGVPDLYTISFEDSKLTIQVSSTTSPTTTKIDQWTMDNSSITRQ